MQTEPAQKPYNLEERTYLFAKDVRAFVKILPRGICNIEDGKQLVRSSGSIGANYLEANDGLSKKDFSTGSESAGKRRRRADTG